MIIKCKQTGVTDTNKLYSPAFCLIVGPMVLRIMILLPVLVLLSWRLGELQCASEDTLG